MLICIDRILEEYINLNKNINGMWVLLWFFSSNFFIFSKWFLKLGSGFCKIIVFLKEIS